MGPGFSWMSADRMMHKGRVNVNAVLFDLGLCGGGVVGNPVERFLVIVVYVCPRWRLGGKSVGCFKVVFSSYCSVVSYF